jgi:hypothetical protein
MLLTPCRILCSEGPGNEMDSDMGKRQHRKIFRLRKRENAMEARDCLARRSAPRKIERNASKRSANRRVAGTPTSFNKTDRPMHELIRWSMRELYVTRYDTFLSFVVH